MAGFGGGGFGSGRVMLVPVEVPWPMTVDRILYQVGNLGRGSVRVGIYQTGPNPESPQEGLLVVESGPVPQGLAQGIQMVVIPDTQLFTGIYFLALQGESDQGSFCRSRDASTWFAWAYDQKFGPFVNPCPRVNGIAQLWWGGLRIKENL